MARRIVVVRSHEPLAAAWSARSFGPAGGFIQDNVAVRGVEFDEGFHPAPAPPPAGVALAAAAGFNYGRPAGTPTYALRAEVADEEAVARLLRDRGDEVVGVYADLPVAPFPFCDRPAVGTARRVAARIGVRRLHDAGLKGQGVRVAIIDTGVNGGVIPVAGGWGPRPGYVPGSPRPAAGTSAAHATMCAFDTLIAAPDAQILDYALLRSSAGDWTAFLSDAIAAFADLIALLGRAPGPLVVNNSWGLYDRDDDLPIGDPGNYSANPEHPFNQITGALVAAGADVLFAAGNCGADCPSGHCGIGDRGPGASIHGANSHPDVITVAAVTVNDVRLGYSSQGPGGLYQRKPDIAAPSQFVGSGMFARLDGGDNGTSAASPVAAGVVAALRQHPVGRTLAPAQMKGLVQRTARDVDRNGWDFDLGYGVISGSRALAALA
ncbi:MAG: S8 family serine peptidase [Dehalococcoidia bacterium]